MGFSSIDDLVNEITVNGHFWRQDWNKLTHATGAQAAGLWYCLYHSTGNPPADALMAAAADKSWTALSDVTTGASGILHAGDVGCTAASSITKHIISAASFSAAATSMPAVFMLVDMLGFYTATAATIKLTTAQALATAGGWLRYASGQGVMAFITPSVACGAGTPTFQMSYTNQAGVSARAIPATLPTLNASAPIGQVSYSGTGAGKYGPFLPLAAGDSGIRSIESFTLSASVASGIINIGICRPLLTLPMTTIGVAAERDLLYQLPSLPKVYDGAVLAWLMYAGANTPVSSAFYGHLDFVWDE